MMSATRQYVRQLEVILEVAKALGSGITLDNLLVLILNKTTEVMDAERSTLFLYDPSTDELWSKIAQGLETMTIRIPMGKGIAGYVGKTRTPVNIPDAYSDPRFNPEVDKITQFKTRNLLCLPLVFQDGTLIGVIQVLNKKSTAFFDKNDENLLSILGSHVAIALHRAQLMEYYIANKCLEDKRKQLLQQEKLIALSTLSRGIAHELKNPLNFIDNFAILAGEILTELEITLKKTFHLMSQIDVEAVQEATSLMTAHLKSILQYGKKADSIVNALLEHTQMTQLKFQATHIHQLIKYVIHVLRDKYLKKEEKFHLEIEYNLDKHLDVIHVNAQNMTRVLHNLLDNAFFFAYEKAEATDPKFIPKVSITTKKHSNAVEIRIRDNGMGILNANIDKIFLPFFSTKPTGSGVGLGLMMSHDIIVQEHEGSLEIKSEHGEFTEAIITIPNVTQVANR